MNAFAQLLYQLLIVEKIKTVGEVAAALDLKEQALYSRLYGRVRFSAEEGRDLLRLLGDVRIADFFLTGSPYVAVERAAAPESPESGEVRTRATSTMFDVTDLMREVEVALSDDGRIDHREKARIEKRLFEAERSLSALRQCIVTLKS
jgi:hypothetical protein